MSPTPFVYVLGVHNNFICQSLNLSVANINIASDKAKSTIGFIVNYINMLVPTEVTSDIYAQLFEMVHMLKLLAMYRI